MKIQIELDSIDELFELRRLLNRIESSATDGGDIKELALDERTMNCLRAEGIHTIQQLISHSSLDVLRMPNIGKKSLDLIVERLERRGLALCT